MSKCHQPPAHHKGASKTRKISPEEEERLQKAKVEYQQGKHRTVIGAARANDVEEHYITLTRRVNGTAKPKKFAHDEEKLVSGAEEGVLVEWMQYLATTGHPLNKRTIRPKVQSILRAKGVENPDEKKPSRSWIRRFIKKNAPHLKMGRGSGLDPKRAKAFNYTSVHQHFKLLKETLETHQIPWRNVYNMDEKGVQMGGGRKGTRTKYFFAADDKMKYKLQSDNLQLVTVIDIICADGTADIGPGFVFPGTTKHREWFEESGMKYT